MIAISRMERINIQYRLNVDWSMLIVVGYRKLDTSALSPLIIRALEIIAQCHCQ